MKKTIVLLLMAGLIIVCGCSSPIILPEVGGTLQTGIYSGTFNSVVTASADGQSETAQFSNVITLLIDNAGQVTLNGDVLYVGFVDSIELNGVSFKQTITGIAHSESKIIVYSDLVGTFYTANVPCKLVGKETDIYESNIIGGINCTSTFETVGSCSNIMFSMTANGSAILSK